jgi:pyruvate dehydrogenase E2 component (dihydrolipoyllysine-residue acetyltransferase)
MIIDIKLPEGEQAFGEGTVLAWKIREGDSVRKGDIIAEIETPKAVIEFESPEDGIVSRLLVAEGEAFPMKETLVQIRRQDSAAEVPAGPEGIPATGSTDHKTRGSGPAPASRIIASPAAKRIAREKGVDLALVRGTGPDGRIVEGDILAFAESGGRPAPPGDAPMSEDQVVPLSPMRRTAAARLVQSKQAAPHFYLTTEVAADRLWNEYIKLKAGREASLNEFIVKAAAEALREFPEVNSSIQGEVQVFRGRVNIGLAVRVEGGLRIPVLRDADRMSLEEIGRAAAGLVAKAREGKVEGAGTGTFTVSNLGMFDITDFAAVINPPEAAILAVGKVREAAVVRDGRIKAGRIMSLTLSCDHRAFDGVTGAAFLARIKEILEGVGG